MSTILQWVHCVQSYFDSDQGWNQNNFETQFPIDKEIWFHKSGSNQIWDPFYSRWKTLSPKIVQKPNSLVSKWRLNIFEEYTQIMRRRQSYPRTYQKCGMWKKPECSCVRKRILSLFPCKGRDQWLQTTYSLCEGVYYRSLIHLNYLFIVWKYLLKITYSFDFETVALGATIHPTCYSPH